MLILQKTKSQKKKKVHDSQEKNTSHKTKQLVIFVPLPIL